MPIAYTTYNDDGSETDHTLPSRWEICHVCRGNGRHSLRLGCFTQDDMDEMGPDFEDDYMSGGYDSACDDCNGTGKVEVVDRERVSPAILASMEADADEEAEYQAMCAAERRMGC